MGIHLNMVKMLDVLGVLPFQETSIYKDRSSNDVAETEHGSSVFRVFSEGPTVQNRRQQEQGVDLLPATMVFSVTY